MASLSLHYFVHSRVGPFVRRKDQDTGTMQCLCTRCDEIVAESSDLKEIVQAEAQHHCR